MSVIQRSLTALKLRARCDMHEMLSLATARDDDTEAPNSDDDSQIASTFVDNPTLLEVRTVPHAIVFAVGAIIGNTMLVIGIGTLLHVEAMWLRPFLMQRIRLFKREQHTAEVVIGSTSSTQPAAPRTATCIERFHIVLALVDFAISKDTIPGCASTVFGLLLQPSVTASFAVAASDDPLVILGGVVGCVLWTSPAVGWGVRLLAWKHGSQFPWRAAALRRRSVSKTAPKQRHNRTRTARFATAARATVGDLLRMYAFVERLASATEEWLWAMPSSKLPRVERAAIEARWSALFSSYRSGYHWFLVVELTLSITGGVVSGVALTAEDACLAAEWGGWLLVGVTVVQVLLHAVLRPMSAQLDLIVVLVMDVLGVAGQVAAVVGEGDDVSTVTTIIGSAWNLAATMWILVYQAVRSFRGSMGDGRNDTRALERLPRDENQINHRVPRRGGTRVVVSPIVGPHQHPTTSPLTQPSPIDIADALKCIVETICAQKEGPQFKRSK